MHKGNTSALIPKEKEDSAKENGRDLNSQIDNIENENSTEACNIAQLFDVGQIVSCTVKRINPDSIAVDLYGAKGFILRRDLGWGHNQDTEKVRVGAKVKARILYINTNTNVVRLGVKQLTPDPWDTFKLDLKPGTHIHGKVTEVEDSGVFVEIMPGIEGRIHVSEISWSCHRLCSASEHFKIGDKVEAVVLGFDRKAKRIDLSKKQLKEDPWLNIDAKYPKGSKHAATILAFTSWAIFVELEEGVDGLIHVSDLSWDKKIESPSEFTIKGKRVKPGGKIDVVVLEVDAISRSISFGHKQVTDNPWDTYETLFAEDSIHEGTINTMTSNGAKVLLLNKVEALAPMRYLYKKDGTRPREGEKLYFKILELIKENKKIVVKTYTGNPIWDTESVLPKHDKSKILRRHKHLQSQETNLTQPCCTNWAVAQRAREKEPSPIPQESTIETALDRFWQYQNREDKMTDSGNENSHESGTEGKLWHIEKIPGGVSKQWLVRKKDGEIITNEEKREKLEQLVKMRVDRKLRKKNKRNQ